MDINYTVILTTIISTGGSIAIAIISRKPAENKINQPAPARAAKTRSVMWRIALFAAAGLIIGFSASMLLMTHKEGVLPGTSTQHRVDSLPITDSNNSRPITAPLHESPTEAKNALPKSESSGKKSNADVQENPSPVSSSPILKKVIFTSYTIDENKDQDTGIFIYVRSADGKIVIAHADNFDNSDSEITEYIEGSTHEINLIVASKITKDACKNFEVKISQQTNGKDTWKFNGQLVLLFSDGSNLIASKENISLINNGASASFSNL